MENKPNLYIFVIDVSSEMKELSNEINTMVNAKLSKIRKINPQYSVKFLFFDVQVSKSIIIDKINHFTIKKLPNFFVNNERNFEKIINEINLFIQKKTSCFNVQKPIIFTNQTSKKFIDIKELSSKYEFILLEKKQNNTNIKSFLSTLLFTFILTVLLVLIFTELSKGYKEQKAQNIQNKINSEIKIEFAKISKEQKIKFEDIKIDDESFRLITKYIFEFSLQTNRTNYIIPYYSDGVYDLENPKCDCPISIKFVNFAVDKIQNDLNKSYINSTYPLYINITGETDSNPIQKPYKYKYENNTTDSIKFVLNGKDTIIKFTENSFITHNKKLACLRSYSIAKFLKHRLPIIENNKDNIKYFATTNLKEAGGEYRKTKIELIYKDYTLFYIFLFISIFLLIVLFLFCFWLFVKYFKGKIIFFNFENNK